jgi:hypothetical protein
MRSSPLTPKVRIGFLLVLICTGVGCAHHQRVQNPLPGVFRVAVAPFGDKSNGAEGVDTTQVTKLFISELQKVPTYEVVPLQEVVDVLGDRRIETNQPNLAYALARAVHAQAVIVGDVTEYNAYYPPVLGLHCEMYAMVTGEPAAEVVAAPVDPGPLWQNVPLLGRWINLNGKHGGPPGCDKGACGDKPNAGKANNASPKDDKIQQTAFHPTDPQGPGPVVPTEAPTPVIEPWVIRHSRIFDGSNSGLVRKLQDYYFFQNDLRGGEWVGYVERVDDFIRFSCNRMIYEMLEAAGGRWTPLVGIEFPMPWEPWPWR